MRVTSRNYKQIAALWIFSMTLFISLPVYAAAEQYASIETVQTAFADQLSRELTPRTSHIENRFSPKRPITREIADNVVSWQMDYEGLGGWSKNFDEKIYSRKWNGSEKISYQYTQSGTVPMSTLDNDATTTHIQYLAAAYSKFGVTEYKASVLKAVDMILFMQHEDGAWGEMYPEQTGSSQFENHSTINDNVHFNNLSMFQKIINKSYPFDNDIFNESYRQKIKASYDKAVSFVIKSQLKKADGTLTLWAGKYETNTYTPRWARHFEPPAIMTTESVKILYHLISIPDKTDDIKKSIYYGAMWFYENATLDKEYRLREAPYFFNKNGAKMWYRFHDIETGRGIYAADYQIFYDIMDLPVERRHGYGWATSMAALLYDKPAEFYANTKDQVFTKVAAPDSLPASQLKQDVTFLRVNGQLVRSDVDPYIQPTYNGLGRIMVPAKFVSDAIGVDQVIWDAANQKVVIIKGKTNIEMIIGSNVLMVNGEAVKMDAVVEIKNIGGGLGRTMLPVAHLARALEVEYKWDDTSRTVSFLTD